jgi:predicted permease
MLKDLRHALRLLLRSKGWTLVVVSSLALGIGANTAIFNAINGLLLRTVPVDHPETLVRFRWFGDNDMGTDFSDYGYTEQVAGLRTRTTFPYPMYQQFRAANTTLLVDLFACAPQGQASVIINGQAEVASAFMASGNYFDVLSVHARVGRTFTPDDDQPDATPVAVLSYGYWMRRFGGDRNAVGTVLQIGRVRVTVVGVTPPEFTGVQQVLTEPRDITIPLALDPQFGGAAAATLRDGASVPRLQQPTSWWLQVMGRLKPGVTPEQVQANFDGLFQSASRDAWESYFGSLSPREQSAARNQNRTRIPRLRVQPGARGIYDLPADMYRSIALLGVVVALVLLIVCANVANLLLSRATMRQREISVRLSMGATRWRLIRQLLTESVLIATIGAAFGILVAYWGRQLLPSNLGIATPIDWRILGFVAALTVATGILFGIAPAVQSSRMNVSAMLKERGRGVSSGRSHLGNTLVVAQVAISLVLLVGAGLFLRTVRNLRHVDVGFETDNLLLIPVNPTLNGYEQPRIQNLYTNMLEELSRVPGVRVATASQPPLLSGSESSTNIYIQGRAKATDRNSINRLVVAPNFFDAIGLHVPAGRSLTNRDTQTSPKVAVINEAAVRKYFLHENPIGQRFGQFFEVSGDIEIVGIVRDAKYNSLRDAAPPTMYVPYLQQRLAAMTFELRTAADPTQSVAAVREAMRRVDPNIPMLRVTTQSEQIEQRFAQEKVFANAYALFGGLAVLVASIGLFGLMSYSVARRTNEIGIRMALGANREDVVGMVMRESMRLIVGGVAIGTGLALAVGRFVASMLFNLAPNDPITIAGAAAVLIALSAIAGYLPARTASRVDPMIALRNE